MENSANNDVLSNVIGTLLAIPGVKIDRNSFLREEFRGKLPALLDRIIDEGPVDAGCERDELRRKAERLINDRTWMSTGISFAAGLPGGFAMAATIPADFLQFYSTALRLAQELAYLYGEKDLWLHGVLSTEELDNDRLMLYCGVMMGASGAAQAVKMLSSALARQALTKLPQKALTKTFYYPIVKSVSKLLGAGMTKSVFAKGVSKAIPILGGLVSGVITFATMRPMGYKLANAFDEARFAYTVEAFEADWKEVTEICVEPDEPSEPSSQD